MNYRWLILVSAFECLCFTATADSPPSTYVIQTVAGSDFVGDGGPALAAMLSQAEGVAVDNSGAVYVADAADNRVRKIAPDGTIQTVAGTGTAGFSGDGGPATSALLSHPYGIAIDRSGNLYIADLGNARVREVSPDGTIQTVAGGGSIVPGGSGDGSPAIQMKLVAPRNVAVDPDGTLYISDFGAHRVCRISPGGVLTTLTGTGTAGFSGDGASAQLAQVNAPAGLASDGAGSLYIADSGSNRIRKIFNGVISTVYNVAEPTGVAIGTSGTLYIAASSYFGTTTNAIAGIPSAFDVTLDAAGNAYATTGQFVRQVASDGSVTTIAGSGASPYFGGDNGPATNARLNAPSAIALDAAGNSYIADTANNRIRRVSTAGIITTIAGTGTAGAKGDNEPATLAQLNGPAGIAVDSSNNLYVADSGNNAIRKITPGGMISTVVSQLSDPQGVGVDSKGSLYIADTGNNRVIEASAGGAITPVAQISKPVAVALDANGNMWVSESTNISKISSDGSVSVVLNGLNAPGGLAFDSSGDLIFAETGVNAIRQFTAAGTLSTLAGTGAAGFSGDGGPASAAQLNSPFGLAVDSTGTVWIADQGNNRIRTLTPAESVANSTAPLTIANAASMLAGSIAPNEIVTIFGSGFDPTHTQILFDGNPATIFYTNSTQINALAPSALTPDSNTNVSVLVNNAPAGAVVVPVSTAAPGIFTTANGTGPAAANNQDGSLNSASNPADRGSVISLYATGGGSAPTGATVSIGGYAADVLYAGPAPGFQGLMQINVTVPAGFLAPGIQPVVITVAGVSSQPGVTIAVR